jgi:hypothetical protein
MEDELRAWFDRRDCGPLAASRPFQAALSSAALMKTKKSTDVLEDTLIEICISNQRRFTLSFDQEPWDGGGVLNVGGQGLRNSLAAGIELADDLYTSSEPLNKQLAQLREENERLIANERARPPPPPPPPAPQPPTRPPPPPPRRYGSTQSASVPAKEAVDKDEPLLKKFRTAKDQYKMEGGQLKDTNTSNTSNGDGKRPYANPSSKKNGGTGTVGGAGGGAENLEPLPPELENFDRELVDKIMADILDRGQPVSFSDISGLSFAKKCVTELICWPMTRPDLFKGLRALPRYDPLTLYYHTITL